MLIDEVRSIPLTGGLALMSEINEMVYKSKVVRVPPGDIPPTLRPIFGPKGPESFVLPCSPIAVEDKDSCVILQNCDKRIPTQEQRGLQVMRFWCLLYRPKPANFRIFLTQFPCFVGFREDAIAFEFGISRGVEYVPTEQGPSRSGDGIMAAIALIDQDKGWVLAPNEQSKPWMEKIGRQQAVQSICTAIEQLAFFKLQPE